MKVPYLAGGIARAVLSVGLLFMATTVLAEETETPETPLAFSDEVIGSPANSLAVDGINGKFSLSRSEGDLESFSAVGAIAVPISSSFGLQVDASITEYEGKFPMGISARGLGVHGFWRDPSRGLFGIYASASQMDILGGLNSYTMALESEIYLDRFTFENLMGSIDFDYVSPEFFSVSRLAYYPTDNFRVDVGHGYGNNRNALLFGGEWDVGQGGRTTTSLFADAAVSENGDTTANFGVRFYFGQQEKTLIRRHREDDPQDGRYLLGSVFLIAVGFGVIIEGYLEILAEIYREDACGNLSAQACFALYNRF